MVDGNGRGPFSTVPPDTRMLGCCEAIGCFLFTVALLVVPWLLF